LPLAIAAFTTAPPPAATSCRTSGCAITCCAVSRERSCPSRGTSTRYRRPQRRRTCPPPSSRRTVRPVGAWQALCLSDPCLSHPGTLGERFRAPGRQTTGVTSTRPG